MTVYHVTKSSSWNRVKANFSLKINLDFKSNLFFQNSLKSSTWWRDLTAIPYKANTGPEQGFPCVIFPHREKPVFITWDPCYENMIFPVGNTTQVKPCSHYRDGFAVQCTKCQQKKNFMPSNSSAFLILISSLTCSSSIVVTQLVIKRYSIGINLKLLDNPYFRVDWS